MKKSKAILSLICAILCVCTVLCSCSGGGNNATTAAGTTAPAAETTVAYTVGEALSSIGLISGEQGDYGLYVKTVNGITADYDKDGTYWAFSVNGELSQKGVDQTYVKNGDIYTFTVTK